MEETEQFEKEFAAAVGLRLRRIRKMKKLSLAEVSELSGGEFGSAVLGAYERGARSISTTRLALLAALYEVPLTELLPTEKKGEQPEEYRLESLRIDLNKLRTHKTPEAGAVRQFIEQVRVERHDYGGRVFTIRLQDLQILGAAFNLNGIEMLARLDELGLLIHSHR